MFCIYAYISFKFGRIFGEIESNGNVLILFDPRSLFVVGKRNGKKVFVPIKPLLLKCHPSDFFH